MSETIKPTLVVLAAGMGSRYGGLKQIDPVGPSGEVVLDYSVYDAIQAGFGKVVFIIRKDIEKDFREALEANYKGRIEIEYVFQQGDDLPDGCSVPEGRTKPWGTAHAVMACRDVVKEPFGVINADDFYGRSTFQILADWLVAHADTPNVYSLVGFTLAKTLSEHGGVSRGMCRVDDDGLLVNVEECHDIERSAEGIQVRTAAGLENASGEELVSMNVWGFTPGFFAQVDQGFLDFYSTMADPLKSEFYIPTVVQDLISSGTAKVEAKVSQEQWFGVTYTEDKPTVVASIQKLIDEGIYPNALWS